VQTWPKNFQSHPIEPKVGAGHSKSIRFGPKDQAPVTQI